MSKLTNSRSNQILSTRGVADLLGTDEWKIRRLFEDGLLDEPPRFAGKRVIWGAQIPSIIDALRSRGWLTPALDDAGPAGGAEPRLAPQNSEDQ